MFIFLDPVIPLEDLTGVLEHQDINDTPRAPASDKNYIGIFSSVPVGCGGYTSIDNVVKMHGGTVVVTGSSRMFAVRKSPSDIYAEKREKGCTIGIFDSGLDEFIGKEQTGDAVLVRNDKVCKIIYLIDQERIVSLTGHNELIPWS